ELVCDHCGRDYGVYAIGLFCPDCGAPNLRLHFARETELVDAQVELAEAHGDELKELAYRLLGNAHEDVLTAFESTLKAVYFYGVGQRPADAAPARPVRNDFQNVDNGRHRFAELNLDPFAALNEDELATLRLNIQKRHIIGHNLGVVDEKFAEHANDARVGETVHLVGEDVRRFAAIGQKVIDHLDAWLVGAPSPTIEQRAEGDGAAAGASLATSTAEEDVPTDDLQLGALARQVGRWFSEQSRDGMGRPTTGASVQNAFPDASVGDLG